VLGSAGVDPAVAGRLVGHRPLTGELPPAVRALLEG
jgi:allantoicase